MQKTILITGGAGFAGSSLAIFFKKKYPDYRIYCLDNLKRRGSELNLSRLSENGIIFIHGDIRNKEDFENIPHADVLIESSAEPSVLAGIESTPDYLLNTNLTGTINCLNFATKNKSDFIFLSTSRVYPIDSIEKINFSESEDRFKINAKQTMNGISINGITEEFPLDGSRSFYGASKLASELLICEYNNFYKLRTVINRCGVISGPWQMGKTDQGVIALWMAKHFWKQPLSYLGYGGTGKQVRDVLSTSDLFALVDYQVNNIEKINGNVFNAGGGNDCSVSLKELTRLCEKITGNKIPISAVTENRQADIRIYITDNSKITSATGWKPLSSIEIIMEEIFHWIKNNESILKPILN